MITEPHAATTEPNATPQPYETFSESPANPQIQQSNNPVNGHLLLDELESLLNRFVILPEWAPETLALWILHTYAFELRDVSTYLGIESPEKRCGKTTLLSVLSKLVNRPVPAANISSSAFFRVIEEMRPTLLIDEADTFLRNNDELRGILNAGYTRDTAYVVRISQRDIKGPPLAKRDSRGDGERIVRQPNTQLLDQTRANNQPRLTSFSCWCPKVMAAIGRFPETLADRCIVIRMQRKAMCEQCERLRNLNTVSLRERCAQFVRENEKAIANAQPEFPDTLHDRAVDIWEPLFALADLGGGHWPAKARRAAEGLTNAQARSPIGALLFDIFFVFFKHKSNRIFSRDLVSWLNGFSDRPWAELPGLRNVDFGQRREMTELWLARQLRPYGIRPRVLRIGDKIGKGYAEDDLLEVFQRYVPRSEIDDLTQEHERRKAEEA